MFHIPADCDPNGWCWPAFTLDRPVIERRLAPDDLAKVCGDGNFACVLDKSGPVCQLILPQHLGFAAASEGWTPLLLRHHELAHCAGYHH